MQRTISFLGNVYSLEGLRVTQARRLLSNLVVQTQEEELSTDYEGVKDRSVEIKIETISNASSPESLPRNNGTRKEPVRVQLSSYQWDTREMRMIRPCVRSIVGHSCKWVD